MIRNKMSDQKMERRFFFSVKSKASKKAPFWLLLILLLAAPTACATASLSLMGRRVLMVHQLDQKDCQNLGPVFGKGGGAYGGQYLADEALMKYAANDLRNNAALMGATHVVFSPHQMGQGGPTTSTATLMGIAYRCPSAAQPAAKGHSAPKKNPKKDSKKNP